MPILFDANRFLQSPLTIELLSGWNWIGFTKPNSMPIEEAFKSIKSNLIMVKNSKNGIYWPAQNINTIDELLPGKGYVILVKDSTALQL